MTLDDSKILLVIPLFNHGNTVRAVAAKALGAGWPVLVVDDGSTDGGGAQLDGLDCRVIRFDRNRGKGAAILAGAEFAAGRGYEAIITVDADGQLDPAEAGKLAEAAAEEWPSLVVGARRMDRDNAPGSSLFGRAFSNFWIRLECGRELPDTQSGFRLYPVRELLALKTGCLRYDFEVESLTRAAWAGLPIQSVPVSVHYPPAAEHQSHFHRFKDNFRLTCLHTRLVTRALIPWPHKRLISQTPQKIKEVRRERLSLLHPVRFMKRLCREHSSALQLASAAWMGVFLGALPLIATHTVAIIYVSHRLHLNKLTAITASQVCMPPLVPVLCIEIGYFMRHGSLLLDLNWETMVVQIHYRLWEWLLGSLLVGPLLGLLVGGVLYFAIRNLRRGRFGTCESPEKG
ncbi:MAG: glycosyltransferase family 2 protein [Desulfurivibrionaceae bacterium]|nr:glycosyltransferase family 2 protein [Desulfurivibrionaceae bacterium]